MLETPIIEDEIFAIMHKEHPLTKKEKISAVDFSEVDLIIHSFPLETVSVYEQFLKPNQIQPKSITAIPLTEVSLAMIQANMGIICMPKWALNSFKLSKELVFKRLGEVGLKRIHYLVIKKVDASKKYINDFIINYAEQFC